MSVAADTEPASVSLPLSQILVTRNQPTCTVRPGEDAESARAAVGFGIGLLDVRGEGVRRCDAAGGAGDVISEWQVRLVGGLRMKETSHLHDRFGGVEGVGAHVTARTSVGDEVDCGGFLSRVHLCDGSGVDGGDSAESEEQKAGYWCHCNVSRDNIRVDNLE